MPKTRIAPNECTASSHAGGAELASNPRTRTSCVCMKCTRLWSRRTIATTSATALSRDAAARTAGCTWLLLAIRHCCHAAAGTLPTPPPSSGAAPSRRTIGSVGRTRHQSGSREWSVSAASRITTACATSSSRASWIASCSSPSNQPRGAYDVDAGRPSGTGRTSAEGCLAPR